MAQPPFPDADGLRFRGKGIQTTFTAGQVTSYDFQITEERKFSASRVMLKNHVFGDKCTLQVVDKDNILGYGANYVLDEFAADWNFHEGQDQGLTQAGYIATVAAGLYIRLIYTSTGQTNVQMGINFYLHKKTS